MYLVPIPKTHLKILNFITFKNVWILQYHSEHADVQNFLCMFYILMWFMLWTIHREFLQYGWNLSFVSIVQTISTNEVLMILYNRIPFTSKYLHIIRYGPLPKTRSLLKSGKILMLYLSLVPKWVQIFIWTQSIMCIFAYNGTQKCVPK